VRGYEKKYEDTNKASINARRREKTAADPARHRANNKRSYEKNKTYYLTREVDPVKQAARELARKLYPVAQCCTYNGCTKLGDRHHPDYNKPADIIWLCKKHHSQLHREEENVG